MKGRFCRTRGQRHVKAKACREYSTMLLVGKKRLLIGFVEIAND